MSSADRSSVVHIPCAVWLGLCALLVAPWIVVFVIIRREPPNPSHVATPPATTAPVAGPGAQLQRAKPGPWGNLEYSRILIEPPEEFILSDYIKVDPFVWTFKGYTDATLADLWQQAGLKPNERRVLDDPARRSASAGAIIIRPTKEFILGLNTTARSTIYNALAVFTENPSQHDAYRMRHDAVSDWFKDAGLDPKIISLTKSLFYQRGTDAMFFSDEDAVLPLLDSTSERIKYVKTLSRKSCVLLQLRIAEGANTDGIARYWGYGRHTKDIRPLLQSLARQPGGGTVDVVHLLPKFARSLLYTYPLPSSKPDEPIRDCHWTSLNFFNDVPDDRLADNDFDRQVVLNNYYVVGGEPTFGDVIMFVRPDGVVVHSCVYLADNFVFTKNGPSFSIPWLIGTLEGVTMLYQVGVPLEIRRYRLKDR